MKKKIKKTKSIKLNYIYNVSYQILTLITPLITAPYLSRVLKVEGIGIYSYTASIVTYFVMFAALGTINYGNREISYLQNDRQNRSIVFWEIEFLSIGSVLCCLAAYSFFILFINHKYTSLFLVQAFTIITVATDISWLLQGMEEFGKIVSRNVVFKILNILFIFIFVKSPNDLLIYVGGLCLLELASNLSIWFYVPQYINRPNFKQLHPIRHLKPTIALFIPTIASTIYINLDKTMLNEITGSPIENGYYEQAFKIYKVALSVVPALGTVMLPRIGKCFSEGKTNEVKKLLYKSYRFIWLIGCPMCCGLIGVSRNFCPWFFGHGYDKVPYILMIQSVLLIIVGLSNVTGVQYLITTKREYLLTRSVCIGAIANFIMNLILIPKFYSYGAAVASVLSELLITIMQFYFVRNEIDLKSVLKSSHKYIIASLTMLIFLLLEDNYLPINFVDTVILVISGCAVYLLMLIVLKDEMLKELIP